MMIWKRQTRIFANFSRFLSPTDLLEDKGYLDVKGPAPAIRQAFQDGYIADGNGWMRSDLF